MRIISTFFECITLIGFLQISIGCTATKAPTPAAEMAQPELSPQERLRKMLPLRSSQDFGIVFTSSVQGNVKPCGCTAEPLGGVSRIAAVMDTLRQHYGEHLLFLDAGDLLFEHSQTRPAVEACQDAARIELLLSTFKQMGIAHTIRGKRDLAGGESAYKNWMDEHQIHSAMSPIVTTLQRVGTHDIGLLALLESDTMTLSQLQEGIDAALQLLKNQKVSHVVVISQLPLSTVERLSWETHPVDAILQGHEPGEAPVKPKKLGPQGPYVLFNGIQGQHLGVLHFSWMKEDMSQKVQPDLSFFDVESDKKLLELRLEGLESRLKQNPSLEQKKFFQDRIASAAKRLSALGLQSPALPGHAALRLFSWAIKPEITPLPSVLTLVQDYESQIPALVAQCEKGMKCESPMEGEAVYVGAQMCVNCHQAAVDQWRYALLNIEDPTMKNIGHAKAWLTLEELSKTRDRQCVGCHSVGFNEPGGYCKTDEVGFLEDVQCESCHGPGSLHALSGDPSLISREVSETTCRECHHVPHIPSFASFNYNEKLKVILGPGHGESKWRQLMGQSALKHDNEKP
jgi:hypothetical protein